MPAYGRTGYISPLYRATKLGSKKELFESHAISALEVLSKDFNAWARHLEYRTGHVFYNRGTRGEWNTDNVNCALAVDVIQEYMRSAHPECGTSSH